MARPEACRQPLQSWGQSSGRPVSQTHIVPVTRGLPVSLMAGLARSLALSLGTASAAIKLLEGRCPHDFRGITQPEPQSRAALAVWEKDENF